MEEPDKPNESLTAGERVQLLLEPATEAVMYYLDTHRHAKGKVQQVGIDREAMAVDVYWVGESPDPDTKSVFRAIEHETGTPIRIVQVMLSGEDITRAGAAILAQQSDAQYVSHELDTLVVGVTGDLTDRPSYLLLGELRIPLRYEQSDLSELNEER